jgi:hypothetical protein
VPHPVYQVNRFSSHVFSHVRRRSLAGHHFPAWMAEGTGARGRIINLLPDPK